nr:hypothetical protein [Tetrasphaera sp. F2B08]
MSTAKAMSHCSSGTTRPKTIRARNSGTSRSTLASAAPTTWVTVTWTPAFSETRRQYSRAGPTSTSRRA